jgi:hypothetical protein
VAVALRRPGAAAQVRRAARRSRAAAVPVQCESRSQAGSRSRVFSVGGNRARRVDADTTAP